MGTAQSSREPRNAPIRDSTTHGPARSVACRTAAPLVAMGRG